MRKSNQGRSFRFRAGFAGARKIGSFFLFSGTSAQPSIVTPAVVDSRARFWPEPVKSQTHKIRAPARFPREI